MRCNYTPKENILECSSQGCKLLSAFYAKVNGESIEQRYQLSKRIGKFVPKNIKDVKGRNPTHLIIFGKEFDKKYLKSWYDILWLMYLDNHPAIVEAIKVFDDYSDKFKSKHAVVCQSDTIRKYIKEGRESILKEHDEFLSILKSI